MPPSAVAPRPGGPGARILGTDPRNRSASPRRGSRSELGWRRAALPAPNVPDGVTRRGCAACVRPSTSCLQEETEMRLRYMPNNMMVHFISSCLAGGAANHS